MRTFALAFSSVVLALAGCPQGMPSPTGAVCPSPDPNTLGYSPADDPQCTGSDCSVGKHFMDTYCIACHDSHLTHSQRNGAPIFHDMDTLLGILEVQNHTDEQAGIGPKATNRFMPPDRCPATPGGPIAIDCPKPTDDERRQMAIWLACEGARDHNFVDAGP